MSNRLTQETIQLPKEHKDKVSELAEVFGFFRAGEPSRSKMYQIIVEFALDNVDALIEWHNGRIQQRVKGGTHKK
jgi:hypothetical protein